MTSIKRFWQDESGPELVEWAILTIILLVAAIALYVAVGRMLGNVICNIICWLEKASTSAGQDTTSKAACDDTLNRESCYEKGKQ